MLEKSKCKKPTSPYWSDLAIITTPSASSWGLERTPQQLPLTQDTMGTTYSSRKLPTFHCLGESEVWTSGKCIPSGPAFRSNTTSSVMFKVWYLLLVLVSSSLRMISRHGVSIRYAPLWIRKVEYTCQAKLTWIKGYIRNVLCSSMAGLPSLACLWKGATTITFSI